MSKSESPDTLFTSTGTIRVEFGLSSSKIFFTPNDDSTGRQGGKRYALFFGNDSNGCLCIRSHCLKDSREGIAINVDKKFCACIASYGLVAAATGQTLVEIKVEWQKKNGKGCWNLKAIAIPAAGKQT